MIDLGPNLAPAIKRPYLWLRKKESPMTKSKKHSPQQSEKEELDLVAMLLKKRMRQQGILRQNEFNSG